MARDILGEGLGTLNRLRSSFMARTVTYQRGSDSVDVPATPSGPLGPDGGTAPAFEFGYFKINGADLKLGGVPVEPQVGDLIVAPVRNSTATFTYAVQPPDGRPAFELVEDALAFKVHAMRVYELGEEVTYYPGGHLYDPQPLPAQIDREAEAAILLAGSDARGITAIIRVQRGAGDGRLAKVEAGKDLVDIDLLRDGQATRFLVERVVNSDNPGFWRLGAIGGETVPP